MHIDETLRRYREDRFTDDDITRCTGLTVRAWRQLIKIGVVRTVQEGRGPGRVRRCDATVFKRAAVIAAINRAGLSLPVSGWIAYSVPFHTVLYEICDPRRILFQASSEADPETSLPPRDEHPRVKWFDPNEPASADPKADWLVEVYDNRFVGIRYRAEDEPASFGDLREHGTRFVAWLPLHPRAQFARSVIAELAKDRRPSGNRFVDFAADYEDPIRWSKELVRLGYEFEKRDTPDDLVRVTAQATARSPLITTAINVTLAIRKALRRYLGIEPMASRNVMESSDDAQFA
jgi:hypothetical protein